MDKNQQTTLVDIHIDDIQNISSLLELPELENLFWDILFILEELSLNDYESPLLKNANKLIRVLEICKLHYIETYNPSNTSQDISEFDILDYYINEYEFFDDIHFISDAKNSVYYALLAYYYLNNTINDLKLSKISNIEFLKKIIFIFNIMRSTIVIDLEAQLEQHNLNSIAEQRSVIGRKAADAKHKNNRQKKSEVYLHWQEEHTKNGMSKNKFAEEYADQYHQSRTTIRKWLQGSDPYNI